MKRIHRLLRRSLGLYSVATVAEWPAVTIFLLRTAVADMLHREGESSVRLQGNRYWLGYRTGETSALTEVLEGAYERAPDFRPQRGWFVLDVGANIGAFAARAARFGARVHAFEPNPDCYRRLTKATQNLDVKCFALAVGDSMRQARLRSSSAWTTTGAIASEGDGVLVKIVPLDSLVPDIPIDLIKVDVEGSEAAALRGARTALERAQRVVLEFHSDALLDECTAVLARAGLVPVFIDRQPWRGARPGLGNAYFRRSMST